MLSLMSPPLPSQPYMLLVVHPMTSSCLVTNIFSFYFPPTNFQFPASPSPYTPALSNLTTPASSPYPTVSQPRKLALSLPNYYPMVMWRRKACISGPN